MKRVDFRIDSLPGEESGDFIVKFNDKKASPVTAGCVGTWELRINVKQQILAGGGFIFERFGFLPAHRTQDYNPLGRDYVSLEFSSSNAKVKLIVNSENPHHTPSFARILVSEGELVPGDSIVLRIGDRRQGGPGSEIYDSTNSAQFTAAVDYDGSGVFRELAASPAKINIIAEKQADLIQILCPSIVEADEDFSINLVVFDKHHNVCEQHEGKISFKAPMEVKGLPQSLEFDMEDEGVRIIEGISVTKPGIYRIEISGDGGKLYAVGNPIVCREEIKNRLFWGDMHSHTWGGDHGMGFFNKKTDKLSVFARHLQAHKISRLDFASPGPMNMADEMEMINSEIWAECKNAFYEHDKPGKYVPFAAYEVHTLPGGDRNIVFKNWEDKYLSYAPTTQQVFEKYGMRDDVFLETHVGGRIGSWNTYQARRERLLEIASGHGCFEWFLQRALKSGYRPAVIGSGDTHLPTLGAPMSAHLYRGRFNSLNIRDTGFGSGPVAGVWAAECTREAIWSAIEQRRTFATTGARIVLEVTVDGHPAGSEIEINSTAEICITIHACSPIERIDLIRSDRCLYSWKPEEEIMDIELVFTDKAPIKEAAYYIRLRQNDGEYAWSTPVWAHYTKGTDSHAVDLPMWNEHETVDLDKLRPNPAEKYEKDLLNYLETEEDISLFSQITPVRLVKEVTGRSALFYAFMGSGKDPVSIRWYYEFDMPRIHLDDGWRDFGMRPR